MTKKPETIDASDINAMRALVVEHDKAAAEKARADQVEAYKPVIALIESEAWAAVRNGLIGLRDVAGVARGVLNFADALPNSMDLMVSVIPAEARSGFVPPVLAAIGRSAP